MDDTEPVEETEHTVDHENGTYVFPGRFSAITLAHARGIRDRPDDKAWALWPPATPTAEPAETEEPPEA